MTHRIYKTSFASVYPHYVAKAERKQRRRGEVDEIICWLTGYSTHQLQAQLHRRSRFRDLLRQRRSARRGGGRAADAREPDKLVDELARGKGMEKILRITGVASQQYAAVRFVETAPWR
jgi:hypothetical protein